jgi:hypothetical protein
MPLTKIQSLGITDGTIVNADINASAAIAGTKLTGVGKVLQVVTATDSTQRSSSSTSFVTISNTLSVSITPSSASNKIFIICNCTFGNSSQGQAAKATIFRDATNLGATNGMMDSFSDSGTIREQGSMSILDSPNTTSSVTYQAYFSVSGGSVDINWNDTKGSITAFEIAG